MSITSMSFLFLASFGMILYYSVFSNYQWQFLLVLSVLFYCLLGIPYTIIYLIISTASTYLAALYIVKWKNEKTAIGLKTAKYILVFTLAVDIGMLGVLKYTNFFLKNFNLLARVFGSNFFLPLVQWTSSLGISYYTLQLVGYLLDCYWGTTQPQKSMAKFSLFACYFPQMLSGPISRYHQVESQLYIKHKLSYHNLLFGIQRISLGFFKKLVISPQFANIVNPVFSNYSNYHGITIWIAAFAFTMQLYTDFSGYMDIILGISECFDIRLPENFKTPFFSQNIQEFWRRWHITLGLWLRDYIMYPLLKSDKWILFGDYLKKKFGKKIGKKISTYLGMLVLWCVMGLWHGNGWKYIIGEGLWFWLLIVLGQSLSGYFVRMIELLHMDVKSSLYHFLQKARTFVCFSIGCVFFRADGLSSAIHMLYNACTDFITFTAIPHYTMIDAVKLSITCLVLLAISKLEDKHGDFRIWLSYQKVLVRITVFNILVFSTFLYGIYGDGLVQFIYQGF